jgi:pantetheine-phosphate adenylyltransferase
LLKRFSKVAVGGTFDQLHRGHITLLIKAFEVGKTVEIGLCSDQFVERMGKPHMTAPYLERLNDLENFLKALGLNKKAEVVPLNDSFGTAATKKSIDALIVSEETKNVATKINEKRLKAGLPLLTIVSINMVQAENCSPISTTKIRKGEIDREGHLLK